MAEGSKIPVFNMTLPAEGPVTIPVARDMSAATESEIDLTQNVNDKWVSFLSGVYIDNSENTEEITLVVQGSKQSVNFPALKQGWVPLFVPNPPVFTLSQSAVGGTVRLQFVNFPVWPYIIDDSGAGEVPGTPVYSRSSGPTVTDHTIAALSGASEEIFAAGSARSYFIIYNPTGNGVVTLNLAGGDAAAGVPIAAGGSFDMQGVANAVTIKGTLGDTVYAYGG